MFLNLRVFGQESDIKVIASEYETLEEVVEKNENKFNFNLNDKEIKFIFNGHIVNPKLTIFKKSKKLKKLKQLKKLMKKKEELNMKKVLLMKNVVLLILDSVDGNVINMHHVSSQNYMQVNKHVKKKKKIKKLISNNSFIAQLFHNQQKSVTNHYHTSSFLLINFIYFDIICL